MNRRRSVWLFTGVAVLTLAWALTVITPGVRPPADIKGPAGPSAVEEGWQNIPTYLGPGSSKPSNRRPPSPLFRPSLPPAKRTADPSRMEGSSRQQSHIVAPSRRSAPSAPEARKLDEANEPVLEDKHTTDVPPTAAPPADATGPGPSPPPPPVLTPPVLLTTPTQENADQHVVLERGQLTTELRLEAREGRVLLRILVRADGGVARAEVARTSGQDALDQAALTAVSSWRFEPATRDGAPIDAWVLIPVRFVIR